MMNQSNTDAIHFFYSLSLKKSTHAGWGRQMHFCLDQEEKKGKSGDLTCTDPTVQPSQPSLDPRSHWHLSCMTRWSFSHWIMKQVIKVTDVWPFILPGLLFNAAIRFLCPNLAHQMASFTVNWRCAVYWGEIAGHFTSSTFGFKHLN